MIKEMKWMHLTNVTDDMLISWKRCSPYQKLKWLEEARVFYTRFHSKRKRILLRKIGVLK